ncbi:diguanylate cyclase [Alkanindiges sp. WGS2144]|uniref:diguanylate cyclase n=1 Tax=Alkanindiges sp. WGS2144 TaxID=3366808 RepID=UPI0037516957
MAAPSHQHNNPHYLQERVLLLKGAVALMCLPSLMVLYGWLFSWSFLLWLFPSVISMKANSAVGFLLTSAALCMFLKRKPLYQKTQRIIALVLILLGVSTWYEYMAHVDLPYLDDLFVQKQLLQSPLNEMSIFVSRMSPLSTVNWILIGASLYLLTYRNYQILNFARLLVVPIIVTSIMVLIGYAYGVRDLYRFGFYNPLSPLSAVLFILLSVSLLFMHAERGFMRLFVGKTLGSRMARGLLPTLIVIFISIGWLGRQGSAMGWYNSQFETSILIFLTLLLSSCLIIWQARAQHGQELLRQRAQHALELSHLQLEKKVERRTYELQQLTKELEALSLTDSLTKLPNRRAFEQRMDIEWQRSLRYGSPLSVMVLDVDHFKRFNDDFGHQTGDHVLSQVGALLAETVRGIDFACRYGGEEFVVILPNSSLKDALPIAERVREQVAQYPWEKRPVTVSIGLASFGQQQSAQELINDADQALYQAKAQGRNRVEHA